jgi:hypothetical protein
MWDFEQRYATNPGNPLGHAGNRLIQVGYST